MAGKKNFVDRNGPEPSMDRQTEAMPYAVPGVAPKDTIDPAVMAMMMSGGGSIYPVGAFRMGPEQEPERPRIGEKEIGRAVELLTEYKAGKKMLEDRIVEDELWWELRHWEVMRRSKPCQEEEPRPEPTSAWMFNAILNKHADAMDNYPEPVVLPRERSDEKSARILSSVLPVVLEYNDYEQTYSDNWWEKLKHGTAAYGVFWNNQKENGLGDIDIREIDLLKLFWEPGVKDIQKSRNLFVVDLVDEELLDQMYPEHKGKMGNISMTTRWTPAKKAWWWTGITKSAIPPVRPCCTMPSSLGIPFCLPARMSRITGREASMTMGFIRWCWMCSFRKRGPRLGSAMWQSAKTRRFTLINSPRISWKAP